MEGKKKTGISCQDVYLILIGFLFIAFCLKDTYIPFLKEAFSEIRLSSVKSGILGQLDGYRVLETKYAKIYYENEDEEYAQCVSGMADFYYPLLAGDFGLFNRETAQIVLYASEQNMQNTLNLPFKKSTMGMYYGGIIHILSPRLWVKGDDAQIRETFLKNGPILHELTHFVMDQSIGIAQNPMWINEGSALYFENKYTNFEWRPDLVGQTGDITKKELTDFRNQDEALVYRRAYEVIADYAARYGEKELVRLLQSTR